MLTENFTLVVRSARAYFGASMKLGIADRVMLITDFILATAVPYLIQFLIWSSIYGRQDGVVIAGYGYSEVMFYFAFAIALGRLNNGYDVIQNLSDAISEGRLEVQSTKPCSYPLRRLWEFLGSGLIYWLPIIMLTGIQTLAMDAPSRGLWYGAGCLAIFLLSQVVTFLFAFVLALISFWLVRADMILALLSAASAFFGGVLLPPQLWPTWLRPIMLYNPLRYLIAAPAEVFVKVNSALLIETLLALSCYGLLFVVIIYAGWLFASRRYDGGGG